MAAMILSLPTPPSWQGVYESLVSATIARSVSWNIAYRCAALNVISSDRVAVIHGIEGRNLINTHGWHFQQPRHLVHNADTSEAVLSLSEIEQGHDGRFLVLARIPSEHLLDELFILRIEFEGNVEVVFRRIAVLESW
jgi:hypothetical protein